MAASIQPAVAQTVVDTTAASTPRANTGVEADDDVARSQLWEELSAEGTRTADADSSMRRQRHTIRIVTVNF